MMAIRDRKQRQVDDLNLKLDEGELDPARLADVLRAVSTYHRPGRRPGDRTAAQSHAVSAAASRVASTSTAAAGSPLARRSIGSPQGAALKGWPLHRASVNRAPHSPQQGMLDEEGGLLRVVSRHAVRAGQPWGGGSSAPGRARCC